VCWAVVGIGFFDMLQGLKIADRLGFGWYDGVIGYLTSSKHFDAFARAAPDVILDTPKLLNAIDNRGTLEEVGTARLLKYDSNGRFHLQDVQRHGPDGWPRVRRRRNRRGRLGRRLLRLLEERPGDGRAGIPLPDAGRGANDEANLSAGRPHLGRRPDLRG